MRLFLFIVFLIAGIYLFAGDTTEVKGAKPKILYGTASFYSNSFQWQENSQW